MTRRTLAIFAAAAILTLPSPAGAAAPGSSPAAIANASPVEAVGGWSLAGVPPGPDGRMHPQVSVSPELGIAVVFGGYTEHGMDNDTYWIDTRGGSGWNTLHPEAPAPPPRSNAAVAWDPDQHRMLMFGGIGTVNLLDQRLLFGQDFLNDVWSLQFDPSGVVAPRWQQLSAGDPNPVDFPSQRAAAAAVYDPVAKRLIVHGGNDTARGTLGAVGELGKWATGVHVPHLEQGLDDIWSFDLASARWTRLALGTPGGEPNLYLHQAVYDPINRQMVVTGGVTGYDPNSYDLRYNTDTWSFDLGSNTWTKWSPEGDPPGMSGGAYGYSESRRALVVTRGQLHWDSDIDPSPVYALRLGPQGQGSSWEPLPFRGLPFPVGGFSGAVGGAVGGDMLVVIGGIRQYSSNEGLDLDARLSSFDVKTGRWETLSSDAASMGTTAETTAVYDDARRHMLIVGGRGRPGAVWDLDLAAGTWRRIVAAGSAPSGDKHLAAAYDSARRRLLVLAGTRVHALSLAGQPRWSVLRPSGDAPSLKSAEAFYDPVRDRLLFVTGRFTEPNWDQYFGGQQQHDFNQKVFALHLSGTPAWRELSPSGPAPERVGAGLAYDQARDRLLMYGGDGATGNRDSDVLELSLQGDGRWKTVTTGGTAPTPRTGAVVAYDSANDRLVVYGGDKTDPATYALSLTGAPTWSKLATSSDPAGREQVSGVYDRAGSRLVVFGGYVNGDNTDRAGSRDTYALALGGSAPALPAAAPETYSPPMPGPVRGGTWTPLGPAGAHTIPVALSPALEQDQTVYAGTVNPRKVSNEATGIYVSRDRGATWQLAGGEVQGAAIVRLAPSPADPNIVYASSRAEDSGVPVYVSRDRGRTWTGSSEGLPAGSYFALAAHPTQPSVAWTAGDRGGLYRTVDGGASWESLGFEDEWVYGLTAVPLPQGVRLLAATRDPSSSVHGSGRVFLSDDLGATWDIVYSNEDYVTYGFAYDPSKPSRVLLSSGNGIWRSEDGGRNWNWLADRAIQAAWLAFDPTSNGNVVYGAGVTYGINFGGLAGGEVSPAQTPGFFRSTDGGKSWTRVAGTPEEDFGGIAVDPTGSFVIATSLTQGPFISEQGSGFKKSTNGFMQFLTASIAVDATNTNHLVAATEYDGARVSEDGGVTWKRYGPPDGQPLWYAAASPVESGRFLGANSSSLYKSENGGRSWSPVSMSGYPGTYYRQGGGIAFDPVDANTWYVALSTGAVAITNDNGSSFTYVTVGGYWTCPIPIAVSPAARNRLLVGDICGSGVWRSEDGGATWTQSSTGLDDGNVSSLALHPTDPNVAWAGTLHRGVYRTDDGGQTWRPVRIGLGYRYVRSLAAGPDGRVYAGVRNGGVFESDDGTTWTRVNTGLSNHDVLGVTTDRAGTAYAATNGGGVARLVSGP